MVYSDSESESEDEPPLKKKKKNEYLSEEAIADESDEDEQEYLESIERDEENRSKCFIDDSNEEIVDRNLYRLLENENLLKVENRSQDEEGEEDYEDNMGEDEILDDDDLEELNEINMYGLDKKDDKSKEDMDKDLDKMGMNISETSRKKFLKNINKELINSENIDGNCTFYSIINSLYYLKTGKIMLIKDERVVEEAIGIDIMQKIYEYKDRLRYCRQKDVIKYLHELNNDLQSVGVCINLFKLKPKERYIFNNWSKVCYRMKNVKVKKMVISMVDTLLLGSIKTKLLYQNNTKLNKDLIVNLVVVPSKTGGNEADVAFIKDVSSLFKVSSKRPNRPVAAEKGYLCEQCMGFKYNKTLYENHVKVCLGANVPIYTFDNSKIINFKNSIKHLPHPFTVYYDLETTCGQNGRNMKIISYCYGISFSEEIRQKMKLNNMYEYRAINQNFEELSNYHLPEIIMRYIEVKDLNLLKKSITNIVNKSANCMERHCALEVFLIIKWVRKMLTNILIPIHDKLSNSEINIFKKNNNVDKCCVCDVTLTNDNEILNKETVDYIAKTEYIRLYSNVGFFNVLEDEYLRKVNEAVCNAIALFEIPKIYRIHEDIEDIKLNDLGADIQEYLVKNKIKDVWGFINGVLGKYKETADLAVEGKEKVNWKDYIIDYEYKRITGLSVGPSKTFLEEINKALEDTVVIHHCHYSGNIYGYAHKNCNSALQSQNQIPVKVYAHNASNFDLLFLVKGFKLSDYGNDKIQINGKPNSIKSVKIGNIQWNDTLSFFQASLDDLSKSAIEKEKEWIKYDTNNMLLQTMGKRYEKLSKNEQEEILEIMVSKGAIPYDMFITGNELQYEDFPDKLSFISSLKKAEIEDEVYDRMKRLWNILKLKNIGELVSLYNYADVIILTCLAQNRFNTLRQKAGQIEPKAYSSTCTFTGNAMLKQSKITINKAPNLKCLEAFEKSIVGGYTSTPIRISFNTSLISNEGIDLLLPDENNKVSKKKVFTSVLKLDQINQYGMAMTKPLPKGGIREQKINGDFDIEKYLDEYNEESKVGHMFKVVIELPQSGINLDLNTQYCPVFSKSEISPKELSPYQIFTKKKTGKNGKILTIQTTNKIISNLGKQEVYLYIESLIFLRKIGWCIVKVKEHYTFLQERDTYKNM